MKPSSSGEPVATYTNIPNNILMYLFTLNLSRPEWKLYLYLRSMKNNNSGLAWPGVRRTIKEAHVSRKDVKPSRDRLVCLDLITTIERPGQTTMIEFNESPVLPTEGNGGVAHSGKRGVAPCGQQTNTNTTTTKTNTKKKSKKKKVGSPSPSSRKSQSAGAKTSTKKALPTVGNTLDSLMKQKRQPTYEEYRKAGGNQWDWETFIGKWNRKHTRRGKV